MSCINHYTATIDFTTVHSPTGYIEVPNMAAAQDTSQNVSANARVVVSQRMVYKEGKLNTGTGNVQWTVNINEDGRDISGMTFKDTMTYTVNNQTLIYDPNEIVNLQVTAYSGGTRQGDVTGLFTGLLSYEEGVLSVTFPTGNWPEGLDPPGPITSPTKRLIQTVWRLGRASISTIPPHWVITPLPRIGTGTSLNRAMAW